MHKRAQDLISELRLHTHPEGGFPGDLPIREQSPAIRREISPLTDNAGGVVLLEVANEAAANDPA